MQEKMTCRWPLALFFNILDISTLGSYIIYFEVQVNSTTHNCARASFLKALAKAACMPNIIYRSMGNRVIGQRNTRHAIEAVRHCDLT